MKFFIAGILLISAAVFALEADPTKMSPEYAKACAEHRKSEASYPCTKEVDTALKKLNMGSYSTKDGKNHPQLQVDRCAGLGGEQMFQQILKDMGPEAANMFPNRYVHFSHKNLQRELTFYPNGYGWSSAPKGRLAYPYYQVQLGSLRESFQVVLNPRTCKIDGIEVRSMAMTINQKTCQEKNSAKDVSALNLLATVCSLYKDEISSLPQAVTPEAKGSSSSSGAQ